MTTNTNAPGQLFDLKQREDGNWIVWTRKSPAELGAVDRAAVETARGAALTDEAWTAFLAQPHFSEPSVWVIAAVYDTKPTVDAVLALLGVKRKPRPEGAVRKDTTRKPQGKRPLVPGVGRVPSEVAATV